MPHTKYLYDFSDSYEAKSNNLNVDAELKVSVLSGLLELRGSGKYLQTNKRNFKLVKCSLIYNTRTKDESFSIANLRKLEADNIV